MVGATVNNQTKAGKCDDADFFFSGFKLLKYAPGSMCQQNEQNKFAIST